MVKITPEIKLYQAMLDGIIKDSLAAPIGELPEYPAGSSTSPEYYAVRAKRKDMNNAEYWRNQSKEDIRGEWCNNLHKICYGVPIFSLRRRLEWMWEKIEHKPSLSKKFIRQFNNKAGANHTQKWILGNGG